MPTAPEQRRWPKRERCGRTWRARCGDGTRLPHQGRVVQPRRQPAVDGAISPARSLSAKRERAGLWPPSRPKGSVLRWLRARRSAFVRVPNAAFKPDASPSLPFASAPLARPPLSRSRGLFVVSVSLEGKVYCVRVRRCAVRGSPSALLRARAGVLLVVLAAVVVVVARSLARSWHMCLARLWLRRTRLCLCLRVCRACVVASLVLVAM